MSFRSARTGGGPSSAVAISAAWVAAADPNTSPIVFKYSARVSRRPEVGPKIILGVITSPPSGPKDGPPLDPEAPEPLPELEPEPLPDDAPPEPLPDDAPTEEELEAPAFVVPASPMAPLHP